MDERALVKASKRLSRVLRHQPERIGIELDEAGWVEVDVLLAALDRHGTPLTREQLDEVVARNDKRRFAIEDGRIRANQGHSVPVDLGLDPEPPPPVLYHGTPSHSVASIMADGLRRGRRHDVHLSPDVATARRVGARRGDAVVLEIDAAAMAADGRLFYRSANGVWLTDHVPPHYLRLSSGTP
ncbi:MAG: RNA 2'-phosphotransferase [Mycobacteriales bacterium]